MRAFTHHVVAAVLVLVACKDKSSDSAPTPGSAAPSGSAAAPAPAPATPVAAPAAKTFDGPTFTIKSTLPGPTTKQKEIDTAQGKTMMTMYAFSDPSDENNIQMVESNPITAPGDLAKARENSMEGMTGNLQSTIESKTLVTVNGTEMLDFTAHFSDADGTFFLRGRVAIKDNTLYQTLSMGSGTKPSSAAVTFVESFTLK
ncbi:hypothetical protein BH11MYX3_BH11MYX3_04610 [soil metagenome]